MVLSFEISCLCGQVARSVEPLSADTDITLCHCTTCRHSTGLLCTSYIPIVGLSSPIEGVKRLCEDGWTRIFCSTCGCHMFRLRALEWQVATGVLMSCTRDVETPRIRYAKHERVDSTMDGGISVWLPEYDGTMDESLVSPDVDKASRRLVLEGMSKESLVASCSCGSVRFHITRPNDRSVLPKRAFPDLMFPYCSTPESFLRNPDDVKWWISTDGRRYLAGTCVCQSCRLISGFEIQTWAFVPRANIFVHVKNRDGGEDILPLDFAELPAGTLRSYSSSQNAIRDFCGCCGATVFWRDHLSDVVDVSVGLFHASDGARAESWLSWWIDRVSFSEEVGRGREGVFQGEALVKSLSQGMKAWCMRV